MEIREKVYVSVREQTVRGLRKKKGVSVYHLFIWIYELCCVTNIVFTHVKYT